MSSKESDTILSPDELANYVADVFREHMPFNRLIGMQVSQFNQQGVEIRLPWHDGLMGNPIQKILHGGVTAAVLDTVGGLMAIIEAVRHMPQVTLDEFKKRISRMSTIDMRVDYLLPGKGDEFIATARVIRKGARVAVCRMELHNTDGDHIAFGTATYMIS
ncbi:thioesterase family protein [Neptunicella marina]|uniref:Medium/long-chain acyl-CoA thioesterase YigI n=1 Tax=Neptunicella marina TaxID=2125989 RepID=A0A8J6IUF8_9ALTE|nr:thioesterase family protein [Neptunicella marina]MBC3766544.1 thioesterase family protein [Neptunicella marina]